jgi:hypothetical protein
VEKIAVITDFIVPNSRRYLKSKRYRATTTGILDIPSLTKGIGSGKRFSIIPNTIDIDARMEI